MFFFFYSPCVSVCLERTYWSVVHNDHFKPKVDTRVHCVKLRETRRLIMSQCKLEQKYFSLLLDRALRRKKIFISADSGLSTKGWPHACKFINHIKWHNRTPTHLHTHINIPYKSNQNKANTEGEPFLN